MTFIHLYRKLENWKNTAETNFCTQHLVLIRISLADLLIKHFLSMIVIVCSVQTQQLALWLFISLSRRSLWLFFSVNPSVKPFCLNFSLSLSLVSFVLWRLRLGLIAPFYQLIGQLSDSLSPRIFHIVISSAVPVARLLPAVWKKKRQNFYKDWAKLRHNAGPWLLISALDSAWCLVICSIISLFQEMW